MAILTKAAILDAVERREIEIDPFDPALLNPASYDVRLGPELVVYDHRRGVFDMKGRAWDGHPPARVNLDELPAGYVLYPGRLAIAHTVERTISQSHVTEVWGKSSIGRMGLTVHQTAGYAEPGFDGQWVLELVASVPIVLRPGLPIAQVVFHTVEGEVELYSGRYVGSRGAVPARG